MKAKKSSRIISLLLAMIMVLGVLPASSITAAAATSTTSSQTSVAASTPIPSNASWTVIGGPGTNASDKELFAYLQTVMKAGGTGTRYIRLGEDIECTFEDHVTDEGTYQRIWVFGDVVFDLNGYRLDVTLHCFTDDLNFSLFHIGNGISNPTSQNKLTVIDSRGKGEIHTNGYIKNIDALPHVCQVLNIFEVYEYSALTINAPGATFRCGRSKKQWVANKAYYAYNQICGSVVVLQGNNDLTVAGGKLQARGYNKTNIGEFSDRCAAIYIDKGYNNINIIDGVFYGKGCASALKLNNYYSNNTITIKSGVFDVFKLERVVTKGSSVQGNLIANGSYGDIGIPDSVLDPDNADIIIGGHNYSEDEDKDNDAKYTHKTVTIKPKTNTKTPDEQIMVESVNGALTFTKKDSSYVINAKNGRAYFSDSDAEYLANDLQKDTGHYYIWTFTLYNAETGEKCKADPIQVGTLHADDVATLDITNFKGTNSNYQYDFSALHYKIKAEVEEVWASEHIYDTKFFNWFYFDRGAGDIDVNEAAEKLDFTVIPEENHYTSYNCYTICTENEDGMEYVLEFLDGNSRGTVTCNSYYRYCTVDSAGKTVLSAKQEIATGTEYGNDIEFKISPLRGGPVYVTVEYEFRKTSMVPHKVDTVTITHQVLALDTMSYDILSSYDKVTDTGLVSPGKNHSYQRVQLSEGEQIVIKPNISADMAKMDVKDPITGKTIDKSEIEWQFSVGLDDYGKHIWYDVPEHEIVDYDVDGVTLPCVKTQRTAWYRIRYDWGGHTYYSPQYILVEGVSYEDTRVATVVRDDNFTGIYGKGTNKLYLDINKNADWYTGGCSINRIQISMIQKPSGASANTLKTLTGVTVDQNNRIELVNTDDFFKNEAGAVTGKYTFRVRVIGTNADGTSYKVTTNYDVWYSQQTTDLNLYVNGTAIYEHDAVNIPYILPADTSSFDFTVDYYPLDSKGNGIYESSIKWTSSNASVLKIDESTGKATSLTPGTVTISCSWKDWDGNIYTRAARVSVPIRNFEIEEIDYSQYVGKKLSEIDTTKVAKIKSVWSYGGKKVTTNVDRYMTIELTSANGWGQGSVNFSDTTVSYNNNTTYGYTIKPNVSNGYFFVVDAEADDDEIEYYVDTSTLRCRGLDNGELMSVENYGATTEWNNPYTVSIDHKNKTYETLYADYMYIDLKHQPVIEDPDAVYLDEVNITVSEPAVGDNRYEGTTYNPMNEYLVLNVNGELGELKTDDSRSYVSKLDTSNMRGTGKPYDDASSEEKSALVLEYMSVWNTTSDYSKWYKPTKTYENGIYVHDVGLYFDSEGANGSKTYLSKDAKVYVNGRQIDYAGISYSSSGDESYVSFKYYFDVGEIPTVSSIKVDGIVPKQGDLPYEAEDATLSASFEDESDASNKVAVESIQWFVDANKNGVLDEGEGVEAKFKKDGTYNADESTLWWDGTFLPGVEYSARIELGTDSETFRFASDMVTDCGGSTPVFDTPNSFIVKFAGDYVIRKVSIKVAEGEDAAYPSKRDPLGLADACKAFKLINTGIYKHRDYSDASADIHLFIGSNSVAGEILSAGKYLSEFNVALRNGDYRFDSNVKVLVNGKDYGEEFAPGRNEIANYGNESGHQFVYCFTTPGAGGVTVSGTATSFGSDTDEVTIQLIKSGTTEPAYETVVKGKSASYSITTVAAGTYTMKVMKTNHVTREYTVTVGSSNVTQDVKIHLLGDIDGNGTVTTLDAMRVNSHVKGITLLTDYALKCADVVGTDGKVTTLDAMRINAHARGTAKLW